MYASGSYNNIRLCVEMGLIMTSLMPFGIQASLNAPFSCILCKKWSLVCFVRAKSNIDVFSDIKI